MKKNTKNIIFYVLCAVLVIFYLTVMYLGANPHVGTEYRMYYLTHELTDWPGYGKLHYDLGTLERCTGSLSGGEPVDYPVANRKGRGWVIEEYDYSRTKADVASVYYIPNQSKKNAELMIETSAYLGDADVSVYAGDAYIGSFNDAGYFYFTIPEVVKDEMLIIRFETEGTRFSLYQIMIS